ncbi:hypothetical protein BJX63DRAFT_163180 [Aspergillus granulosus]|uniref:Uncharacterized protein n=1 Tax=Aspergillus granulosus TaxID=176169 RepID=A0ABR4HIJ2_9EURO
MIIASAESRRAGRLFIQTDQSPLRLACLLLPLLQPLSRSIESHSILASHCIPAAPCAPFSLAVSCTRRPGQLRVQRNEAYKKKRNSPACSSVARKVPCSSRLASRRLVAGAS